MQDNESGILSPGVQRKPRTAGGLILPTTRDPTKVLTATEKVRGRLKELAGDLITTPAGLEIPAAPNKVMIVTGKKPYVPTDIEVIKYANKSEGVPAERSGSEMALAEFDLPFFLSNEVKKKLGNDSQAHPYLDEVATNIEKLPHFRSARPSSDKGRYSSEVLQRGTIQTGYYDINQGKRVERTVTKPGPLEAAAIVMTKLLQEPSFHNELGNRVIVCLSELMKNYRTETKSGLELPEMPDFVRSLSNTLDILGAQTHSRRHIYDLLSQIVISPELGTEIIDRMDKFEDLDHPLAYQLTLSIAQANPEASWIKLQQERRRVLLEQLKGSNQDVFDNYNDLFHQSRRLVIAGDLLSIEPGRVGMEIEYGIKEDSPPSDKNLPVSWSNGRDYRNGEIRRSGNHLKHDEGYRESLVPLSKWFLDSHSRPDSLHLHFDLQLHPHKPYLGGLYELGRSHGKPNVYKNDLGTWEIRGNAIPRVGDILQPARIEDLIEMYLQTTKTETIKSTSSKIKPNGSAISYSKLIFGHIASYLPTAEGRLALLMSLHDPRTLRAVNPMAFAQTYDDTSLKDIATLSRLESNLPSHQMMVNLLKIAGETQFGKGWLQVDPRVDESQEQAFIRKAMESSDPLNFAKEVEEMYSVTQIENKLQVGQQLTNTDLNFLYGVDKKDHPDERNPRIKVIRSKRNLEKDMAIIFGCSQDQIAHRASEINANTKAYVGPLERDIFLRLPEQVNHIYTSFPEGGEIQKDKLTIGGMPKSDLERVVTTGRFHASSYASSMMRNRDFTTLQNPETIDTVRLKVSDLGFTDYPTTDELFKRAQFFGLELCPAETGPHLRLKDANQPLNEWYYIAMKPIPDSDGDPDVFKLGHIEAGLWLDDDWTNPDRRWFLGDGLVFRLRK